MKRVEAAIQKELIRWLTTKSVSNPVAVAANNNEHARHQVNMGVEVGSADLMLRQRRGGITHFLYLELKRKSGKLSPAQIKWNEEFDLYYASDNCERAVAYSLQEAKDIIEEWVNPHLVL